MMLGEYDAGYENCIDSMVRQMEDMQFRINNLHCENAKLRELAGGLGQCAQGVDCEDCLLYDLSEPDHCREERLWRELGVEVE